MRQLGFLLCLAINASSWANAAEASWPQFRGPNASGRSQDEQTLPAKLGPERNVVWKTTLPPGHSSPVVVGDRIYLTGVREQRLVTLALDRSSGSILWEREAPHEKLETIHGIGSHAQSSPAADQQRVVVLFGSCGLFCYDRDGTLLWQRPMGPFSNTYGAGSSPLIVEDWVILNQDHDADSFLMALDKHTGTTVWKTERPEFPRGYATPVVWNVDGKRQLVVVGTLRVVGYDLATGSELWTVRGISRITNMTPVVGDDNVLYVAAWAPGGDETDRIEAPTFASLIDDGDANRNGMLEEEEVPFGPIKIRFAQIDRDKSGQITQAEYDDMRRIFEDARNVMLAIKPGGRGDVTDSHVLWTQTRRLPYVPSPLYYRGHLFLVKNGGIFSCFDPHSGKATKYGRVSGTGDYYSSPVAADGKIFLLSQRGELTVLSAQPQWRELAKARFEEECFATPAIVGSNLYLRTAGHLYCFGGSGS